MEEIYLLLGSNIGNREEQLKQATKAIAQRCGEIVKISSVYETEPWGLKEQSAFLNQALMIKSSLSAQALLRELQTIEQEFGRIVTTKWGPRHIDIDILFYGNKVIDEEHLKVPHPFLHQRMFTLEPLNEIAPTRRHPVLQKTINELLQACPDNGKVTRVTA